MSADAWYVSSGADPEGPLSADSIRGRLASGALSPDAFVWQEGMAGWVRLGDHPPFAAGAAPPAPVDANDPEALDRRFGALVKDSWRLYHAMEATQRVDDAFIGALITALLDSGHSLIDLVSDGTHHSLRVENDADRSRVFVRVTHLTHSMVEAQVLGHLASVVIGYGERTDDFARLWQAVRAEYKSGLLQNAEPGTVTFDADTNQGYIYAQVDLYWNISKYVDVALKIDHPALSADLTALLNGLRKYLRGRTR